MRRGYFSPNPVSSVLFQTRKDPSGSKGLVGELSSLTKSTSSFYSGSWTRGDGRNASTRPCLSCPCSWHLPSMGGSRCAGSSHPGTNANSAGICVAGASHLAPQASASLTVERV